MEFVMGARAAAGPVVVALLALALQAGGEVAVASESAVLALHADNFAEALKAHPLLLVDFYAPWCGHCKQLEPEFEKAADHLRGRVSFAKVDATYEVSLAEDYQVEGYPTVHFFKHGRPEEYTGSRENASIVQWVSEKSGPAVARVGSQEELRKQLSSRVSSTYFVAQGPAALGTLFGSIAERNRGLGAYFFLEAAYEAPVVQIHRGIDEVVELRGAAETAEEARVLEFLRSEMVPPFGEINEDNYGVYLTRASAGMLWVVFRAETFKEDAKRFMAVFRELAASFPQFAVVYIDPQTYDEHVREELGCKELPALVLQIGNFSAEDQEPKRYKQPLQEEGLAAESLAGWVGDVLAGKVEEEDPLDLEEGVEPEAAKGHTQPTSQGEGNENIRAEL